MTKCPYCHHEGELVVPEIWKYVWWDVYFYKCSQCKGRFKWRIDPADMHRSYLVEVSIKRESPLTYNERR
jgi:DNA-directed RNA polymerase subunit RPC12/RpoP